MDRLRVLIADDHPLFRKGLRSLLESEEGIDVVGEATSASETVDSAARLTPDLVLMDLHMPGGGLEATRALSQSQPDVRVLVVTMHQDDDSVFTAIRAGARGYVLKDANEDEMLRAIMAVGRGEAIFSPEVASRVLDYFGRPRARSAAGVFPELTLREEEVLAMLAEGHGNRRIAVRLGLSSKTVANYVSQILAKLQVADRAEAAAKAREAGLGAEPG